MVKVAKISSVNIRASDLLELQGQGYVPLFYMHGQNEAIARNAWEVNLDAIAHARELILNHYQLFPFLANQIRNFSSSRGTFLHKKKWSLSPGHMRFPLRKGNGFGRVDGKGLLKYELKSHKANRNVRILGWAPHHIVKKVTSISFVSS